MLCSVKWAIKNHGAERTNGRKRKEQLRAIIAARSQEEHWNHNAMTLRVGTMHLEKSSY
jgi:hypothetical protein